MARVAGHERQHRRERGEHHQQPDEEIAAQGSRLTVRARSAPVREDGSNDVLRRGRPHERRGQLLLQGGRVVAADGEYDADVLIEGEKIAAVGDVEAPAARPSSTSSGCLVMPGLIDNHTHLSMPFMGMMSSDDYDTGTRAAAAGGVTCLVDFSIQREPDKLRSALDEWQGRADGAAHVDYGFHMAITNANESALDDMEADDRGGRLLVQAVHGLQGRADGRATTSSRRRWSAPATSAG